MIKIAKSVEKNDIERIEKFIFDSFFNCVIEEKPIKQDLLNEFHKISIAIKDFNYVSIIMSYLALNNYKKGARYYQTLNLLNDAKYLANSSNSLLAQKINLFCMGIVEYLEKNINAALNFFKASLSVNLNNETKINDAILKYKNKIEKENPNTPAAAATPSPTKEKNDALLALLQIGRTIAIETNIDTLLTIITQQIQLALDADRCSVFLLDNEHNELWSKIAFGLEIQEIRFPVTKGLAGHVALSGETINIKNAYESEYFNKDIDLKTGYKTKNILCIPIRNLSHQIIGVFQVLNKHHGDFTQKDEDLLVALGSSAGIALENAYLFNKQKKLIDEQQKLFSSFVDTLAASIDARDKITSGHSKRVTAYACLICDKYNLSDKEKEIIKIASLLHDIGKIGIKDSVLQKEGRLAKKEYEHIKEHVKLTHNILSKVYISKNFESVAKIASSHHEKYDGTGYFKGLKGEEIPFGGRVLAVCDVFDAITSKRHYRDKMEIKNALKIMLDGKNKYFDAKIVEAFFEVPIIKILDIMLAEKEINITQMEEKLLNQFNLNKIYVILNKEDKAITKKERNLIEIFNKFYQQT